MRRLMVAAAVPMVVLMTAGPAAAQSCGNAGGAGVSCSVTGSVTAAVPHIVRLAVSNHNATLTPPDENLFELVGEVQIEDPALQVATVRANSAWTLTLTGASWTAPWAKPLGDLEFDAGSGYTAVTGGVQSLGSGSATNGTPVTLGYRTRWALAADVPGSYSMALTFTVAAP